MLDFFSELRRKCKPPEFKVESISSHGCVMLDLSITKGTRFGQCRKLDIRIHFKPSNQGVPLDDRSCHPPQIHSIWPLARFSSFNTRCTCNMLAVEAKPKFFGKLVQHHPRHRVVARLVDYLPTRRRIFESRSGDPKKGFWLAIPYHPALDRMSSTLIGLGVHWNSFGGNFKQYMPRLSWRIGHASLASVLAKDAKKKTSVYRNG